MIDLSKYIVHDLTHTYDDKIKGYSSEIARTLEKDGWNAKTLTFYSHSGTHMDSPYHFGVSHKTIEEYHPSDLMSQAWVYDVSISKPKQLIKIEDLQGLDHHFKTGDSLLIRTRWSINYDQPNFKTDMPRISDELAEWCVTMKVKMLGVEPLSVADVENLPEVTRIHKVLLGGGVIIIEGLKNLDAIKSKAVFLMAMPIKIKNGDGGPARVIAFEKRNVE